jgi:uncharacterized protein YcbX
VNQARRNCSFLMEIFSSQCLGEELNSSYVSERGLPGDRTYAVVDQNTSKVSSAKNPRKWGKFFDCRSIFRATKSS